MSMRSPLFRRYIRILVICMGGLTCTAGIVHMIVLAEAQWESVTTLLDAQTRAASAQIQGFLDKTVASLQWIDDIDQPGTALDLGAVSDEAHRLLRRAPSVIGLSFFDVNGCERLLVSRVQPDVTKLCGAVGDISRQTMFSTARRSGTSIGDVFFPDGSEPHLLIGVPSRGVATGALIAEINLKVIHDTVAAIRIGKSGLGFVVDGAGRLIAHPDETLVLRQAPLPSGLAAQDGGSGLRFATDFSGQRIATVSRDVMGTNWRIMVEQPAREALAPVFTALITTGLLVVAALAGSLIAGFIVAQRLTSPLSQLRDGAAKIGQGDLTTRLSVTTGDEIEQVAEEFNRMALALSDSHADLEAKVADRTAALLATTTKVQHQASQLSKLNSALALSLDEAQLRKADAEHANAAKSRFLAVASHDLRQPMHAISLLVGLLHCGPLAADQDEVIRKIQGSVDAMEDLFVSLLDISKLDAGTVQPAIVEFPVEEILQRVRNSFAPLAEEKGLTLLVEECAAIVRSDPALLERILFNLVTNAIRYTPLGRVNVFAEVDHDFVRLVVADTGIGIPDQYRDRIYEEFFQIATVATKGLGLGLSIVKQCADLLGYKLSLESDSSGSSFRLEVPLVGLNESRTSTPTRIRQVSERLSSAFVVLIDDDEDNRYAAEKTYRQWGCRTLSAETEAEAVRLLGEHLRIPDLIVTDLDLQNGRTGITAIKSIRSDAECRIPAIVLSGETNTIQFAGIPECCLVLQKPVGAERLKEASEHLLLQIESGAGGQEIASV
jgi:signal transduction histidine kinase/CheY-like chemotaxis protein